MSLENVAPVLAASQTQSSWGGTQLLAAFKAAASWLEHHIDAINALNVFPVPDGDTGTNMSLTLSGALQEVSPDSSCAVVAERVKYWAMMRGRGNSGIILSQVLRGMAQGLAGHEWMGGAELAQALVAASQTAYQAVMKPVEGTMLTVIREMSEAASAAAGANIPLLGVLDAAVQAAHASVQRTPDLLKTLRDAGVVDAGGQGLAIVFEGMLRYARGESLIPAPIQRADQGAVVFKDIHGPDDFGYCTNFVIVGTDMPFEEVRAGLAALGTSVVVVGDETLIKAHLHTLHPGEPLNYAVGFGALTQIEIANMDMQREALHDMEQVGRGDQHQAVESAALDEPIASIGVVAVAPGPGFAAIFRSLNVDEVVGGGQTMNPSTEDLLAAIERLPQHQVIVLPNNSNIVMAARQAAQLTTKQVEVVPTKTVPQGIAAKLRFNYQTSLQENVRAMTVALQQVRTAEITSAVRDAAVDGLMVRTGQTIGLLDGDLVTAHDRRETVIDDLLQRMQLNDHEVVTVYYGQSVTRSDAEALVEQISIQFSDLDIEVQEGGQPLYDYIISAE